MEILLAGVRVMRYDVVYTASVHSDGQKYPWRRVIPLLRDQTPQISRHHEQTSSR